MASKETDSTGKELKSAGAQEVGAFVKELPEDKAKAILIAMLVVFHPYSWKQVLTEILKEIK